MSKHDTELVMQVFLGQKNYPTQGDFVTLVSKDLNDINISYEEATTNALSKGQLKSILKKNAINAAFCELKETLLTHKKVKDLKYERFEMQPYLKKKMLSCDEKNTTN